MTMSLFSILFFGENSVIFKNFILMMARLSHPNPELHQNSKHNGQYGVAKSLRRPGNLKKETTPSPGWHKQTILY